MLHKCSDNAESDTIAHIIRVWSRTLVNSAGTLQSESLESCEEKEKKKKKKGAGQPE